MFHLPFSVPSNLVPFNSPDHFEVRIYAFFLSMAQLCINSTTDWFFFLLLDLGNKAIESIPVGVRVVDGMLQAAAVRAAGFAIVNLSALVPAVKCVVILITTLVAHLFHRVLYVIMMYISVCMFCMSCIHSLRSADAPFPKILLR
jgi:Trk-type K+ transport system membrane component